MRGSSVIRSVAGLALSLVLAGCAGVSLPTGSTTEPAAAAGTMAGRWMLSAPGAPTCGMAFKESGNSRAGSVSPEGGCPATMFRSRQWAFEDSTLIIKTDEAEVLARLTLTGDSFKGQSASGTPLTLIRYAPPAAQ